jgi:hypothetical protein
MPGASTGGTKADLDVVTDKAISQLETILGLAYGTIIRSSDEPMLPDSEVALTWSGGRADVDADTGLICFILLEAPEITAGSALGNTVLEEEAERIAGLLGWDAAALTAQGFTPGTSRTVDRGSAGAVYQKTWVGHDEEGIPNQGLIEIGLDKTTGELRSFLFSPGPRAAAPETQKVTKNEAIEIAAEAASENLPGRSTTTSTPIGRSTTTAPPLSYKVASATLVHTDAPGITGGGDALVWIVKLTVNTNIGKTGVTVYVDAVTGEARSVMVAG